MCQVLFHGSPRRQVLPSFRPSSLQLVLGQMFPAGGSPGPACAPSLVTPVLSISSPQPLSPHLRALLSYQPALTVQPHYSSTQFPPPAQSHNLVLLSASPQGGTLPRQEPQEVQQGEAQSPCTWGVTAPGTSTCLELLAGKQLYRKHPGAPGGQRADHEPIMCPCHKEE